MNPIEIDHIGILVDSVQNTVTSLKDRGVHCNHIETFPEVGMKIAFTDFKGKQLEFLEIISPDSPAANHKKGLHHLAFQVDDIQDLHDRLQQDNAFDVGAIRMGREAEIFFFELNSFRGIRFECMQKSAHNDHLQ
jgi:4-hydroxyphenylpyruvate dioxygenase-like putative hemolysin